MMIVGLAILACLGILIVWCMYIYNSFKEKQALIDNWWDEADAYLQLRRELIPSLISRARPIMSAQKDVLDVIFDIREKIVHELVATNSIIEGHELEELENRMSSEIRLLRDAFKNHRDAQLNPDLLLVMSELDSIEGKAVTACEEYNKLTADFNSSIRNFPANLVVSLLHFHPMEKRIFGGIC